MRSYTESSMTSRARIDMFLKDRAWERIELTAERAITLSAQPKRITDKSLISACGGLITNMMLMFKSESINKLGLLIARIMNGEYISATTANQTCTISDIIKSSASSPNSPFKWSVQKPHTPLFNPDLTILSRGYKYVLRDQRFSHIIRISKQSVLKINYESQCVIKCTALLSSDGHQF